VIITRTPFRISFVGGGTDYPAWYLEHGGAVLGTTINKYCYINCRYLPPFFGYRFHIVWSKNEVCSTVDQITHPAVREALRFMGIERGVEIHHDGDLPARSGIGSSSAFTVGLLNALYGLKGQIATPRQLAMDGIHIERDLLKESVGSQDQVSVAYGGLNKIVFAPSGEVSVQPITLTHARREEFESHLLLLYTGIDRTASDVAKGYEFKDSDMQELRKLVDEAVYVLCEGDLLDFGWLLSRGWEIKRSMSKAVSNPQVEEMYSEAIRAGAFGGKLIGAGGGGFMLLFAKPADQKRILFRLNKLVHVPFKFEYAGSQTIFFEPEEDFSSAGAALGDK
jgi:D-glycero-alpha-D-manno-heptose-7-phosphate kinase